jgi:hypothetical protein
MNKHYFPDFAMVRFSIPPRLEITFEGDPDRPRGWYYRFAGADEGEYRYPHQHHPSLDVGWQYSDTTDAASTRARARRAAARHARKYEGPANVMITAWGNVLVKGRAWGRFAWELPIIATLRTAAAQLERQKKWEVLIPQKFELEILNRDEVAALVASIAESR